MTSLFKNKLVLYSTPAIGLVSVGVNAVFSGFEVDHYCKALACSVPVYSCVRLIHILCNRKSSVIF